MTAVDRDRLRELTMKADTRSSDVWELAEAVPALLDELAAAERVSDAWERTARDANRECIKHWDAYEAVLAQLEAAEARARRLGDYIRERHDPAFIDFEAPLAPVSADADADA